MKRWLLSEAVLALVLLMLVTSGCLPKVTYTVDYLAVAAGDGILIVDVSDPEAPKKLDTWITDGYARGVYVSGDNACVVDDWNGFVVVDVSDPENPALVMDMFWPSAIGVFGFLKKGPAGPFFYFKYHNFSTTIDAFFPLNAIPKPITLKPFFTIFS